MITPKKSRFTKKEHSKVPQEFDSPQYSSSSKTGSTDCSHFLLYSFKSFSAGVTPVLTSSATSFRKLDSLKPLLSKPSFANCTTSSATCLSHLIWVMGFSVLQIYLNRSQCRPFLMVPHKQSYLSCLLPFLSIFQRNFNKRPVICIETHNLITQPLSKKFKS